MAAGIQPGPRDGAALQGKVRGWKNRRKKGGVEELDEAALLGQHD